MVKGICLASIATYKFTVVIALSLVLSLNLHVRALIDLGLALVSSVTEIYSKTFAL